MNRRLLVVVALVLVGVAWFGWQWTSRRATRTPGVAADSSSGGE